tara:strand:+ start:31 stop:732 length:702 start_codon:yes stop_codon:yes gene_type:complete
MKKYFIDEQDTFAINEELGARVELMGWQEFPIVYMDNFYKNPDKVRNLALRCPSTTNPRIVGGTPGTRVDINMNLDHFFPIWQEIAQNVYGLTEEETPNFQQSMLRSPFSVNVTQSGEACLRDVLPHMDYEMEENKEPRGWAGLIYLNKGDECKGGTGFYNYKGQQVDPRQEGIWKEEHVSDSVGPWELIHLAEMKYNRLIYYPLHVLHGSYDKPDYFTDSTYRLVQTFFLPV